MSVAPAHDDPNGHGVRRLPDWLRPHETDLPLVLGHRGSPRLHEENSVPGFLAALEAGADGIELDVRVTKDDVPVVVHDPDLKRTHGENIRVDAVPHKVLPVPTLSDVVRAVRKRFPDARLDIELKAEVDPDTLEATLDPVAPHHRIAVTSFDLDIVRTYRRDGRFATGYVVKNRRLRRERVVSYIESHDMDFLAVLNPVFLGEVVEAAHRLDTALWVWTANRTAQIVRAIHKGADAIITDYPEKAAEVVRQHA